LAYGDERQRITENCVDTVGCLRDTEHIERHKASQNQETEKMNIRKQDILIDSLDCIVTISYVEGHSESYAIEKMVQIYEGNAYVSYDEEALDDVINFISIDMLDKYVKDQLKEVA